MSLIVAKRWSLSILPAHVVIIPFRGVDTALIEFPWTQHGRSQAYLSAELSRAIPTFDLFFPMAVECRSQWQTGLLRGPRE